MELLAGQVGLGLGSLVALSVDDTLASPDYDEFGLLHENAEEWGIPWSGRPEVERRSLDVGEGQTISYVVWGREEPEVVFLHGGGQNAHTWDTVLLALGRPAMAVDLPGHGLSSWRRDRDYGPWANAAALERMMSEVAPQGAPVVGMSLGGATTIRLAAIRPDLVRKAVLVDVTPKVSDSSRVLTTQERGSVALIGGSPTFDTFDAMANAAITLSPLRPASGVRRGVRHNAYQLPDGRWRWRYDLFGEPAAGTGNSGNIAALWWDVERIIVPTMFLRGGLSKFVRDEDVAEMRRRLPGLRTEVVDGAGHSIQSDRPLELVRLLEDFIFEVPQ